MINRKLLWAIALVLVISLCAFVVVSADGVGDASVDGLVTFDGYSARMVRFNGLRSQYTLDTDMLAELEKSYKVEIGMLLGTMETDDAQSYQALTVDNCVYRSVFYTSDEGYKGKCYDKDETDGKIEFVYAVTYSGENTQTAANYKKNIVYRAYVILTDFEGASDTSYVDNISELFGYTLSLSDIAEHFVATSNENYPMLQRVISVCNGSPLSSMTVLEMDLDRYSIVIGSQSDLSAATALNTALKSATGYVLPIVVKNGTPAESAIYADAYIYINTAVSLSNAEAYNVFVDVGIAEIQAEKVATAAKAARAFVTALKNAGYAVIDDIKYVPDWTKPIK